MSSLPQPTVPNRTVAMSLFVLLGLAAWLRLPGVADRVLWYDELYSVSFAAQSLSDLLVSVQAHDPHPPLYYLQLHLWMKLGTDEAWLRLNSILWGLLAILPTYLIGRRLFGEAGGLWAALLLTVSPAAVYYAHEVRMYAMQMCLIAFNLLILERILAREHRWFDLPLFFLTLVASCYVQGAGFLLLLPVSAYILLRFSGDLGAPLLRRLLAIVVLAALCALPWLIEARSTNLAHLRINGIENIPRVMLKLFLDPNADINNPPVLLSFLALAVGTLGALIWVSTTRNLAIAYVLVTFSAIVTLAHFVAPLWHVKTLAGMLPVLAVMFGGLFATAFKRIDRHPWTAVALTGLTLVILLPYALSVNRETDFRRMHYETAQYLLRETEPGDTIEIKDTRDFWTLAWYLSGPGSIKVDNQRRTVQLPGNRQVKRMENDGISAPGTWRVERNDDWRDHTSPPLPSQVENPQTFARFLVYRQP